MKKVTGIIAVIICAALVAGFVPGVTFDASAAKKTKCDIGFNKPLDLRQYYYELSVGKSKTLCANYDFNGDGKKDSLTIVIKRTGTDEYSYSIKINKKKIDNRTVYWDEGFSGLSDIYLFDLNPKDKNTEIRVVYSDLYTEDSCSVYRYTGKKIKNMGHASCRFILKQNNNDYLQKIVPEVRVEGFGHLNIDADTNKDGIIKNKIYNTSSNYGRYIEFQFTRSLTLFDKADGKKSVGSISVNDKGCVTKVKINKKGDVSHVYIELKNGKAGWLKLEGQGFDYESIVTEENGYCGVA